jgi:hypothetical protein
MALRIRRLREHGVTVAVASGAVSPEDIMADLEALDPADAAPRWINYLDPTIDLSAVDVAFLPLMRRLAAAKMRELHGDGPLVAAWVSPPDAEETFRRFWPNYTSNDDRYPAELAAFGSIEAACEWLGLSEAAREAVVEVIEGGTGAPQPVGRIT